MRQYFVIHMDAENLKSILVPKYAKSADIKSDKNGYWLNVSWNCGVIAALTTHETDQALGETDAKDTKIFKTSRVMNIWQLTLPASTTKLLKKSTGMSVSNISET